MILGTSKSDFGTKIDFKKNLVCLALCLKTDFAQNQFPPQLKLHSSKKLQIVDLQNSFCGSLVKNTEGWLTLNENLLTYLFYPSSILQITLFLIPLSLSGFSSVSFNSDFLFLF